MPSHNVRFIQEARIGDTAYALCFDFDRSVWLAEVHLRSAAEVYYANTEYPQLPHQKLLEADAYSSGIRSPRPFHIGQHYDASVTAGVMALFVQLCRKHDRDPAVLFAEAYPGDYARAMAWDAIKEQAEWEGVVYPTDWSRRSVRQLCAQLVAMRNQPLAQVVLQRLT